MTDPEVGIAQVPMNAEPAPALPTVLLVAPVGDVPLSSMFVRDLAPPERVVAPGTGLPPGGQAQRARVGPPAAGCVS